MADEGAPRAPVRPEERRRKQSRARAGAGPVLARQQPQPQPQAAGTAFDRAGQQSVRSRVAHVTTALLSNKIKTSLAHGRSSAPLFIDVDHAHAPPQRQEEHDRPRATHAPRQMPPPPPPPPRESEVAATGFEPPLCASPARLFSALRAHFRSLAQRNAPLLLAPSKGGVESSPRDPILARPALSSSDDHEEPEFDHRHALWTPAAPALASPAPRHASTLCAADCWRNEDELDAEFPIDERMGMRDHRHGDAEWLHVAQHQVEEDPDLAAFSVSPQQRKRPRAPSLASPWHP